MTLAILLLSRSGGPTHDASFFTPQYDFWRSVFTKMAFCQMLVSWNQSSFKKMQPMAAAEVALKSPLIPLFQRGNYSIAVLTPLWKRGEGEISTRRYGNYLTNFNSRTLVWCFRNPLNHLRVIPGRLAIPPEADQPEAEASATRNPGTSKTSGCPLPPKDGSVRSLVADSQA